MSCAAGAGAGAGICDLSGGARGTSAEPTASARSSSTMPPSDAHAVMLSVGHITALHRAVSFLFLYFSQNTRCFVIAECLSALCNHFIKILAYTLKILAYISC